MKICHVTNVHGPFDGRIFHKMACSAVEYGHEVILVAPHNKEEIRNGVQIIPISKPISRIKRFLETGKLIKIMVNLDADIYHFHDPELIPTMKLFHKKSGKKVIYDIHEYYKEVILSKTWIPSILKKLISMIVWSSEISACKSFECTISATEELSKVYEPYSKRNEFILNYDFKKGIDFTASEKERDIDIIHVGSLSKKRFQFLLSVAEELYKMGKNYSWYYIGVPDELIQYKETNFNDEYFSNIHLIKKIPFEDVKKYYSCSKIGINYHPIEKRFLVAIPMKIFEYMKYGLTVITSDLPPIRKYVINGENGFIVKSNTIEAFANIIEQVMNYNNIAEIGLHNKKIIYEKYNWEMEATKLMKIYETL